MNIAVWDTYVKASSGNVMHFDILVPDTEKNIAKIYEFGREYLTTKNENNATLDVEECQFCHIEEATEEMKQSIAARGYFIIEMEEIAEKLSAQPSRKEMTLHLRAHYPQYRFADFRNKSIEEITALIQQHA